MTIGNRVLELLEAKKLKKKDLAAFLETTPSTISGWKEPNRNPSSDLIVRICEFLGVSYEYLLTGTESHFPSGHLSPEDAEWLKLIHSLPRDAQLEFRGELKGYLKAMGARSSEEEPLRQAK